MQTLRKSTDRGSANFGWLHSRHTFSFGHYFDPQQMGFGPLRVINEDRVDPGCGFDTHGHRDMEIISYVVSGALRHEDNMGNGSVIRPGDVQRMSAGTGVLHSEFNASDSAPVHFLQIWIEPERSGLQPSYEQKAFTEAQRHNQLRLVASRDGREGSVTVHRDVNLYAGLLEAGHTVPFTAQGERQLWLQVVSGELTLGYCSATESGSEVSLSVQSVEAGDGVAFRESAELVLSANSAAEILLFDMSAA